jgi:hypothetical protein
MSTPDGHVMQCMEVWGGNQPVDGGVVMAGLDAWVYSRSFGAHGSDAGTAPSAAAAPVAGGGDVYYVSSCATGRITRLLVADVSGHGAAVCDVAGQLRLLMRRYVNHIDPIRFVRSMNTQFAEMSKAGCFATAIVTTFFAPTGELSLCNAGHPPPLLYRGRTRTWSYLEQYPARPSRADPGGGGDDDAAPLNVPLGLLDASDYERFDVRLRVGDLVLCYTDSLVESRDARGDMLGQAGLLDVARSLDVSDPAAVIPALLDAVAARGGTGVLADDVTLLLFRPNGLAKRAPFHQRALAPLRVMAAWARSMRPGGDPVPWPEYSLANQLAFNRPTRKVIVEHVPETVHAEGGHAARSASR